MATYTIYASTADGEIVSASVTYSTARAGGGSVTANSTSTDPRVGQNRSGSTRTCYETFLSWDLTSVVGLATSAVISLYGDGDSSTTDFTFEVRENPWGPTLATADWVAGASLASLTLLASLATSGGWSTVAYNALTSEAALLTAVDAHGSLEVVASSSRLRNGNDPSGSEYVGLLSADQSGTSQDPKIDITTIDPGQPLSKRLGGVVFAAAGPQSPGIGRW